MALSGTKVDFAGASVDFTQRGKDAKAQRDFRFAQVVGFNTDFRRKKLHRWTSLALRWISRKGAKMQRRRGTFALLKWLASTRISGERNYTDYTDGPRWRFGGGSHNDTTARRSTKFERLSNSRIIYFFIP